MANPAGQIDAFLAQVRASVLTGAWKRAIWLAIAATVATCVAIAALGHWLGASRQVAVSLIGIGSVALLIVLVSFVIFGFVVPRRLLATKRDIAKFVGRYQPSLRSDLLSSVEFSLQATQSPLAAAHVQATAERVALLSPLTLVPDETTQLAKRLGLGVVGAGLALALAVPQLRHGTRQLLSTSKQRAPAAALSTVPLVGDLQVTVQAPPYSGRQQVSFPSTTGDIRALAGSHVQLQAKALLPFASAELVIETGTSQQTIALTFVEATRQLEGSFTVATQARYRFAFTNVNRRRTIEATPRNIELEPDRGPLVQLIAPAESLDVSNLRQVELAYVVDEDFAISGVDLVWQSGKDNGKKPIPLAADQTRSATGKLLWDIGELTLPAGARVRYWLEAKDNNNINGPGVGRSKEYELVVVSPRERHEQELDRLHAVADAMLEQLALRLVAAHASSDVAQTAFDRQALTQGIETVVAQLADVRGGFDKDPHASDAMRKAFDKMRERLEKLVTTENAVHSALQKDLIARGKPSPIGQRFAASDKALVAELEDDVLILADWLQREQLESMLDVADEVAAHRKRLADLLDQFAKTGDPRLKAEIEREMRALSQALAQMTQQQRAMPQEVLDQFVNRDALTQQQSKDCLGQVQALFASGDIAAANAKLVECAKAMDEAAAALEQSLADMRGDRFGEEQRKLDEVMNELADTARDQDDIAGEASRIFDKFAADASAQAKDHKRDGNKQVASMVDKLRRQLGAIPEPGLTPFSKEELDVVERRLADAERTAKDGDIAETIAMVQQAEQSLQTVAGELEAAMEDEPDSPFADQTADALAGTERARATAKELLDSLRKLAPSPADVMSADDKRALERLRRRQTFNRERATKLAERAKQLGSELPGTAGAELQKRLANAVDKMQGADGRMKATDPGGAREATRAAAEALESARQKARDAARQRQEGAGTAEEPIRIPGADDYQAPHKYREQVLEAMKKRAPSDFDDMLRRYYEEIVR